MGPSTISKRIGSGDWKTIAPFAALFGVMLLLAVGALFVIAREADRSDASRAREAVERTFKTMMDRMQGAAEINAVSTPNALQLAGPTINLVSVVAAYNFASPDAIG